MKVELGNQDRPSNRLAVESSPYLRQHASNPVDWYAWGPEALARAKAEDKPIHLSIGYAACHWCHVMARECFENPGIAELLNEHFVNVKVDREERPDLDDLYQKAAQIFLGRAGGWPLTMFLTPDQEPFYGGTYFPPVPRHGLPGFPQVVRGVIEAYRKHGSDVKKNVERVKAGLARVSAHRVSQEPLNERLLDDAVGELERFFDTVEGGFGDGPKFPAVPPLNLMLRQTYRTKEARHQEKVLLQLRKMAAGGIYDHLGGGFHRYSVDGRWVIPHFEKMLYDNAQLVRLYLDGWRLTKDVHFRQVVEDTLLYLRRELAHPDGPFFAAQDADSEGEEGRYFAWNPEEILTVLGQEAGQMFCRAYGVTDSGNFEGNTVLNRQEMGTQSPDECALVEERLGQMRAQLLAHRELRVKPLRDENIIIGWNALAVSAFLDAHQTFGSAWYLSAAERALTWIVDYATKDGLVFRTVADGQGRIVGYLDDHAFLAAALLDAFEATSHVWYLEQARSATDCMLEQFWDDSEGGFYFTGRHHEPLIHRMKSGIDGSIPSGNAAAVQVLLRLFSLTGERLYDERAEQTLRVFRDVMEHNPYGTSAMLCALDLFLSRPKEVVIVGARDNPVTESLLSTVHHRYVPNKILFFFDESRRDQGVTLPAAAGKSAVNGQPTAYVCQRFSCSPPVTESGQLDALL